MIDYAVGDIVSLKYDVKTGFGSRNELPAGTILEVTQAGPNAPFITGYHEDYGYNAFLPLEVERVGSVEAI
jgi:hypothetical protein